MLHAFTQKNIRRVLSARTREEHTNQRNEDAVTSMVFSPLAFMRSDDAAVVAAALFGAPFQSAVAGRQIARHDVDFWPAGLKRLRGRTLGTRCEPDLVLSLIFDDGAILAAVGEMKWDMPVTSPELQAQVTEELGGVGGSDRYGDAELMSFTITKARMPPGAADVQLTWSDVHARATALAKRNRLGRASPAEVWGRKVGRFLALAEQLSFQGFRDAGHAPLPGPAFYRG